MVYARARIVDLLEAKRRDNDLGYIIVAVRASMLYYCNALVPDTQLRGIVQR